MTTLFLILIVKIMILWALSYYLIERERELIGQSKKLAKIGKTKICRTPAEKKLLGAGCQVPIDPNTPEYARYSIYLYQDLAMEAWEKEFSRQAGVVTLEGDLVSEANANQQWELPHFHPSPTDQMRYLGAVMGQGDVTRSIDLGANQPSAYQRRVEEIERLANEYRSAKERKKRYQDHNWSVPRMIREEVDRIEDRLFEMDLIPTMGLDGKVIITEIHPKSGGKNSGNPVYYNF